MTISHIVMAASPMMLISLLVSSGVAQNRPLPQRTPAIVQIDHIIVAISDLQEGVKQVEEMTGVQPVYGGRHPGVGTQNALIALGPRLYLEILAPQPDVELSETLPWELDSLTPVGFAVSTTDMAGTVAWLQDSGYVTSVPTPGSRSRPDGATMMWTVMGITDPAIVGAPFFIQWGAASPHPAATSPKGCALRSLTVFTSEQAALDGLFDVLGLEVSVQRTADPDAAYELVLECPNGTVSLK